MRTGYLQAPRPPYEQHMYKLEGPKSAPPSTKSGVSFRQANPNGMNQTQSDHASTCHYMGAGPGPTPDGGKGREGILISDPGLDVLCKASALELAWA
jgi:hypothetical protein